MKLYRKIETGARTYNYFCPVFVGDRIVGSSYSQYVICFDKNTGEPFWQKKKKAGSEPSQVIDADKGIIYSCGNIGNINN